MDEYDKVVMNTVADIYFQRLHTAQLLDKMEKESFKDLIIDLNKLGEDELAERVSNKKHKAVEEYLLKETVNFMRSISIYLNAQVRAIFEDVFIPFLQYIGSDEALPDELARMQYDEFITTLSDRFEDKIKKLKKNEKEGMQILFNFLVHNEMYDEEKVKAMHHKEDIWPFVFTVYMKIAELRTMLKIVHKAIIEERVWKGELFVK